MGHVHFASDSRDQPSVLDTPTSPTTSKPKKKKKDKKEKKEEKKKTKKRQRDDMEPLADAPEIPPYYEDANRGQPVWKPMVHFDPDDPENSEMMLVDTAEIDDEQSQLAVAFHNKPLPAKTEDRSYDLQGDLKNLFGAPAHSSNATFSLLSGGQEDSNDWDSVPAETRIAAGSPEAEYDQEQLVSEKRIPVSTCFFFHFDDSAMTGKTYHNGRPAGSIFTSDNAIAKLRKEWTKNQVINRSYIEERHELNVNRFAQRRAHRLAAENRVATLDSTTV
ncbi:hypothetical protein H4R35_003749 [Dimargaris xerosporica]|nr:hypothetical protein H4R35_003749 [Dimargaris xerosporica]